jgi:CubicO group peptidase (beta-lactamase class C family)
MLRNVLALPVLLVAGASWWSGAAGAQAPETTRVDALFAEWDQLGSPGAAVAVLKDGEIVLERGYGSAQLEHGVPVTPATIFHVASVTKQFTTFAVAILEEQRLLSLDDDVRRYLPELPDFGHTITLRHLVHHTSGLRDQWELLAMAGWRLDDVITRDQILALATRQRELNFPPGTEHLYSNLGYTLLAEVVARVGGGPFPEWMEANVFLPLGMTSTHIHDDHQRVVPGRAYSYHGTREQGWRNAVLSYANAGATSLFTTAGDLARWLRNYETAELGGPRVIRRMRERGVLTNGDTIPYAFAIIQGEHRGRTAWHHTGSDAGFRSVVLHIPEEGLGVVVLANLASVDARQLATAVADIFLGENPAPGPAVTPSAAGGRSASASSGPAPVAQELTDYVGNYYSPELEAVYRLALAGDTLVARHVRHGDIPLVATGQDVFAGGRWFFARLTFTRDDRGRVDGFRATGSRVRDLRFERLPDGALP